MSREIGDGAALKFSEGFYRALAYGNTLKRGLQPPDAAQVGLDGLPDVVVPHFRTRETDEIEMWTEMEVSRGWPEASRSVAESFDADDESEDDDAPKLYPLWFGTNRAPLDPKKPSSGFGSDDDRQLHYGTCQVAVPKSHRIGSVGSSFWKRLLTWTDDRLKLVKLDPLKEDMFWASVRDALIDWNEGPSTAVVFIHGFNVSSPEKMRPVEPPRWGSTCKSPA